MLARRTVSVGVYKEYRGGPGSTTDLVSQLEFKTSAAAGLRELPLPWPAGQPPGSLRPLGASPQLASFIKALRMLEIPDQGNAAES